MAPLRLIRKGHGRSGDAARDAKQWAAACRHYEAALAEVPSRGPLWVQLGHARKEMGRLEDAVTAYRRALALEPDDPETHLHLAHVLKRLTLHDDAAQAFISAVRLQPQIGDAGRQLETLGYTPAGKRVFGAYLSGPLMLRRQLAAPLLVSHLKLTGLTASGLLGLNRREHLQLGCGLYGGSSADPPLCVMRAHLHSIDEETLQVSFQLPAGTTGLRLARIGIFYDQDEDEPWQAEVWTLIDFTDDDLTSLFTTLAEAS